MTAWYGFFFEHVYIPSFDPDDGTFVWQEQTFPLIWDDVTKDTTQQQAALVAMLTGMNDEKLSRAASFKNKVTMQIAPGLNQIPCKYPAKIEIQLVIDEVFFNTWYKNEDLRKMGYFNVTNQQERSAPAWINAVNTDYTFQSQWGDGVEIMLAQGASGSATVYPWAGAPPSFYINDFTDQISEYSNGWYWIGPSQWDDSLLEPVDV